MTIPELETERLRLRGWRESDLPALAEFMADGDDTRFIGGPLSRGDTWRRMAIFIGHWQLRGFGNWVVEEKSSAAAAGYGGLWMPEGWPEGELMWGIFPTHRGRGYATEAARRARAFAYETLRWPTVVSYIAPENEPSRKVATRLGAIQEGKTKLIVTVADVWRHPSPTTVIN